MKKVKRLVSAILSLAMAAALIPPISAGAAQANTNSYGHQITYSPVTYLYTTKGHPMKNSGLMPFRLFDAQTSQWAAQSDSLRRDETQSYYYLYSNDYLLNKFMNYRSDLSSSNFTSQFLTPPSFNSCVIRPNNHNIKKYNVYYDGLGLSWNNYGYNSNDYYNAMQQMNSANTGNIGNMLRKGDIEYMFSHKIKTVETSWWLFSKSHDWGRSWIMGEYHGESGNGWHNINCYGNGPNITGVGGWHSASSLSMLRFEAESDKDDTNDAYLSGGMLIGRDIHGPEIASIKVTSDAAGKNVIRGGKITLDAINKELKDRTIYFQVEWDEPVVLNNVDMSRLTLKVQTIGEDGTSGMIAEAPFLSFAPAKTDSTQMMTFEYRIPDPYTDTSPVTQERGFLYNFSKVVVSANENETFYNSLTDLSGNKFASDKNGNQPSAKKETAVSMSPVVDLKPFAVNGIRITKDMDPANEFVTQGELLSVTLEMNKSFAPSVFGTSVSNNYFSNGYGYENLPSITLNIKDKTGSYVTLSPTDPSKTGNRIVKKYNNNGTWKNTSPAVYYNATGSAFPLTPVSVNAYTKSGDNYIVNSVTYNIQLYPGYTLDGDTIRVTKITPPAGAKDASGYTLMSYEDVSGILVPSMPYGAESKKDSYTVSPDKQYKLDYIPPVTEVSVEDVSDNGSIIKITATVSDESLSGTDAAFHIQVNGTINTAMQYQVSSDGSYGDSWTRGKENVSDIDISAPLTGEGITKKAYLFVNLEDPWYDTVVETDSVSASVTVSDEARNISSVSSSLPLDGETWQGYDTIPPKVSFERVEGGVNVTVKDQNDVAYRWAWDDYPSSSYDVCTENTLFIPEPDIENPENIVYEKTLYVIAEDSKGNKASAASFTCNIDMTYTELDLSAEQGIYSGEVYPSAEANIKNSGEIFWVWLEKPANLYGLFGRDYDDIISYVQAHGYLNRNEGMSQFWNHADMSEQRQYFYGDEYIDPETGDMMSNITHTISADADTPVIAIRSESIKNEYGTYTPIGDDALYKWEFYTVNEDQPSDKYTKKMSETNRPVILLVGAMNDEGGFVYKTVEFDTFYNAPSTETVHYRFTTNDINGVRQDNIRNINYMSSEDEGWFTPDKGVNIPNLYDIAEAEFYVAGDPATGYDRIDKEQSEIQLVKITGYAGYDGSADFTGSEETVKTWKLSETPSRQLADSSYEMQYACTSGFSDRPGDPCAPITAYTVSFDPNIVTTVPYERQENGSYCGVRYEFRLKTVYRDGNSSTNAVSNIMFLNNTANGYIYSFSETYEENGNTYGAIIKKADFAPKKEVIFDSNNKDITADVPLIKVPFGGEKTAKMVFSVWNDESLINSNIYSVICGAPRNTNDSSDMGGYDDTSYLGTSLYVVYDADLSKLTAIPDKLKRRFYELTYDSDLKSAHIEENGISSDIELDPFSADGETHRLYYRFYDSVRNTLSPVYAADIVRDTEAPTVEISVSETEKPAKEVTAALASVSDKYTRSDMIEYTISAYMGVPGEAEQFDADENGIYHFTQNGYIDIYAADEAGNMADTVMINGKKGGEASERWINEGDRIRFARLYINNIDTVPPKFTEVPVWSENIADGSITVTAKADDTAVKAAVVFDKTYTELVTGTDYTEDEELPQFDISQAPGVISYKFENGKIQLKLYIKHDDAVRMENVKLVISDEAGNSTESKFAPTVTGIKPFIKNSTGGVSANVNGLPVYSYGGTLDTSVPVRLEGDDYTASHSTLPIYSDGVTAVTYTDLFGQSYTENIYANITGAAFAHSISVWADDRQIDFSTPVNKPVTIKIDTGSASGLTADRSEITMSENGKAVYTLTNASLGQSREYSVNVTNIDTTPPEAIVSSYINSAFIEDTGVTEIYSVTYTVAGFSEDASLTGENAVSEVTFDISSTDKTHTFEFADAAGNKGTYTADISDIAFSAPRDTHPEYVRVTFRNSDTSDTLMVYEAAADNNTAVLNGYSGGDVVARVDLLNKAGEVISGTMTYETLSYEVAADTAHRSLVFRNESFSDRSAEIKLTSTSGETVNITVTVPSDAIDKTAPAAAVNYAQQDDGTARAYLVPLCSDISNVGIFGTTGSGKLLELKQDETGYYVVFDENGSGYFILTDKAGNTATLSIAVANIDTTPPEIAAEGWSGIVEGKTKEIIDKLLTTPTNNSIYIFFSFNELLSRADIAAYDADKNRLESADRYVSSVMSGNTLTVEFKQNCQARIDVYDTRGNLYTLWRPEDGPITVIDKDAPALAAEPQRTTADNIVNIDYSFNEDVVLLTEATADDYKKQHTLTFNKNGQRILTFADRAGNVISLFPVINEIDTVAPYIKINTDAVGNRASVVENGETNVYTSDAVRIYISAADETADDIKVSVNQQGGGELAVTEKASTFAGGTYTHYTDTTENGTFVITASDKWGNENKAYISVTGIDRTPPTINGDITPVEAVIGKTDTETVKAALLDGVSAKDVQSGAGTDGISFTVDMKNVDFGKEGTYTAEITAADRLGNKSYVYRQIQVRTQAAKLFLINGKRVEANDVYTSAPGTIKVTAVSETFGGEKLTLYMAKGYKTAAQMKYAEKFNAEFDASEKGYYTIMAQSGERGMYLVYVYIY